MASANNGFTLSPYDFPLTDNTQLDERDRFALNLCYIATDERLTPPGERPPDERITRLQLRLVWFPDGYITERERPMNYYQVNRTLGLQ